MTGHAAFWGDRAGAGYSLQNLADRAGWRVTRRFARGACPACESSTGGWGCIFPDGAAWVDCHACGDWRAIRAALRLDAGGGQRAPVFRPPPRPPSRAAALDLESDALALDSVYRVLSDHLALSSERRYEELARRRQIPTSIRDRMPRLLSPPESGTEAGRRATRQAVEALRSVAADAVLRRVPELAARRGGAFAVMLGQRGATYLEPWRDEEGRITALRAYYRGGHPKYKTTAGRTGPLLHVAYGVPRERVADVPWLLTEGWMKAEVSAHALGVVAIAFPGVNAKASWKRAIRIKQRLAPAAPTYVAYDAEVWTTRPDIAAVAFELAREVRWEEGRCAGFAAWDAEIVEERVEPKGIDDAILAGREIHLVDRIGFGAYLGPAFERWDRRVAA